MGSSGKPSTGGDSADGVFAFPLALSLASPHQQLFVSLHETTRPSRLFALLKDKPDLCCCRAEKFISLNQLVAAANATVAGWSSSSAWDVLYKASPSTHRGHVMDRFSFGNAGESQLDNTDEGPSTAQPEFVLLIHVGAGDTTAEQYLETISSLTNEGGGTGIRIASDGEGTRTEALVSHPMDIGAFFGGIESSRSEWFRKEYKLSMEDIEKSSLEDAVLSKVAAKYVM